MSPIVAAALILVATVGAGSTNLECFPVARLNSNGGCFLKKIVESKSDPKMNFIPLMGPLRACCLAIPAISLVL